MKSTFNLTAILAILLLLIGMMSIYTVHEGQAAIILRLGKIEKDPATGEAKVKNPGIHFKLPVIEKAKYFDIRLQTLDIADSNSSRIVTKNQKYVIVDYYVKWRIEDIPLYFTRTRGQSLSAETLLRQQLNDGMRAEFGRRTISEVVSDDRTHIMDNLRQSVAKGAAELGIKVVDVRLKRIDLPPGVTRTVYERMSSAREQVAAKHRADGRKRANIIRATADADVTVTLAEAQRQAATIRSSGLAKAARTYSDAYKQDPEFYAFSRSLNAYKESFKTKHDVLIMQPKGQFFKYFSHNVQEAHQK